MSNKSLEGRATALEFLRRFADTNLKLGLLEFFVRYPYAKFTAGIIARALGHRSKVDVEEALGSFFKAGLIEKHTQHRLLFYCLTADPEKRQWVLNLGEALATYSRQEPEGGLEPSARPSPYDTYLNIFEVEKRRFNMMKKELLRQYDGNYVVIWIGQVVDSDKDVRQLVKRTQENYRDTPVYIGPVGKVETFGLPSPRVR